MGTQQTSEPKSQEQAKNGSDHSRDPVYCLLCLVGRNYLNVALK